MEKHRAAIAPLLGTKDLRRNPADTQKPLNISYLSRPRQSKNEDLERSSLDLPQLFLQSLNN